MSFQNPIFIPGPTNMPEDLRRACDMPTLDHRSPLFGEILLPALEGVAEVVGTELGEVFAFPATGTAGWEVALTNTLSPGDAVLATRNGMFSHRWIDMCRRHGLEVTVIERAWGEGIDAQAVEEALRAEGGGRIRAVLATHNETATGVVSDIAAVRAAMDAAGSDAMLFVDGVSSIASMPFHFDRWGVDVAVTGSQKGFMLPPGLAIAVFSAKAAEAARTAALPRTFLDVADMRRAYEGGGFPYTPPVGLLNGLNLSCQRLLKEGMADVWARHRHIADGVRAAVDAWGLDLCAVRPELRSDTVSAIRTPKGFDANRFVAHAARRYGTAFGTGLGEVAGRVFRIGHLGSLTEVMALGGIACAEMTMRDLGLGIEAGSGVAAAQEVYRGAGAPLAIAAE